MALLDRLTRTIADATRLTQALMEDPSRRMPPERPVEPAQPSLPGPEGAKAKRPDVPAGVAERARVRAAAEQAYAKATGDEAAPARPPSAKASGVRPAGAKGAGLRPAGTKKPAAAVKEEPAKKAPKKASAPKKAPKKAPAPKKASAPKRASAPKKAPKKTAVATDAAPAALRLAALDVLHQAVLVVSPERRVVHANPAMCRYLGLLTGREWSPDQLHGEDVQALHPSLRGEGAAPAVGELAFASRESRLEDEAGELIGFVLERIPLGFRA